MLHVLRTDRLFIPSPLLPQAPYRQTPALTSEQEFFVIPKQQEAEILRLWHAEKWKIGTIARQLDLHHSTVRRVLRQDGIMLPSPQARPTMADPYLPFMREVLEKYPTLTAIRLFEMVKQRGYPGAPDHFRSLVARIRPRPAAEAYLRLTTLVGEQAQVDWGHFGKVTIGKAERRLYGFVMTLSWSRAIFLRFYLGDHTANFLRGHAAAFDFFGGIPREILYDNLKSAVIERVADAIRFNDTLLAFSAHYRYLPKPVAVARGNEKGRVERAIRYIRDNFFAARPWRDLDDLNAQAAHWCATTALERPWPEDRTRLVKDALTEERPHLLVLPDNPFPVEERLEVKVGKTPYARFDLNDYSIPHTHVRRTLVVSATPEVVRVLEGNQVIATHRRSFDKAAQIEDASHIQGLADAKREARHHRGLDRLSHAVPGVATLLEQAALRGLNLGGLTSGLLACLDRYGQAALEVAVREAIEAGTPHLAAVRQILERRRHERSLPPPIPIPLPDDPRIQGLYVRPHALTTYDLLAHKEDTP